MRRVSLEGLHQVGEGGRAANFTRGLCHLTGNGKKKINRIDNNRTRCLLMSNVSLLVNTKMFILQLMKCTVNRETLDLSLESQ